MTVEAYSEEAFHFLLDIERKRAGRSKRAALLLLAHLNGGAGNDLHIESEVAAKLFQALRLCLRETDFVGWYRRERIAGAVLTEGRDLAEAGIGELRTRIADAISRELPEAVAGRLHLQIHELPSTLKAIEV